MADRLSRSSRSSSLAEEHMEHERFSSLIVPVVAVDGRSSIRLYSNAAGTLGEMDTLSHLSITLLALGTLKSA